MEHEKLVKHVKKNVKTDEEEVTIHSVRKITSGNALLAFKS